MFKRTCAAGAATCLALAVASGCGSDNNKSASPARKQSAETAAPKQLVGEYAMTLKSGDLPPNPVRELTDGSKSWTLRIANSGGVNNAPALSLENDQLGGLESSRFGVIGQRIVLHSEECPPTGKPVESEYTWTLKGRKLRFSGGRGACPDKVQLTLLTAKPWTRKG
jgi:hypothetical protein